MSILPRMIPCEICGGIFPVDTFAYHNCDEIKRQIEEDQEMLKKFDEEMKEVD